MSSPTLPEVGSFTDIPPVSTSRESSEASAMETSNLRPLLRDVYQWTLAGGWSTPIDSVPEQGFDTYTCVVKSDTHPDMVADMIAEYLTDTIVRIDSQAHVDLSVMVKQDLIVVTGQVASSHPAKGAIIHSEQYLGTLNASIRDFLREVGFVTAPGNSTQTSTPMTPPQTAGSPRKQASTSVASATANSSTASVASIPQPESPNGVSPTVEDEDQLDPAQVHVILAITQGGAEELPSTVVCKAISSQAMSEAYSVGRSIEQAVAQYRKTSGNIHIGGGVVVEVELASERIPSITVSFQSKKGSDRLLSEIGESVLESDYMLSLSPRITPETVIVIRNVNRANASGLSSAYCGKDWRNPLRYGHVLAYQEANRLIKASSLCRVEMQFSARPDNVLTAAHVLFGESQQDVSFASKSMFDRLANKRPEEVRDSIFIDPNSSCLSFNSSASSCSPEALSRLV
jgi:hypothetical protein